MSGSASITPAVMAEIIRARKLMGDTEITPANHAPEIRCLVEEGRPIGRKYKGGKRRARHRRK